MFRLDIRKPNGNIDTLYAEMIHHLLLVVNMCVGSPNVKSFKITYERDIALEVVSDED